MPEDAERLATCEERLSEMDKWAAEHDGRINAYWQAQHSLNKEIKLWQKAIDLRMSALERKIMWIAGIASTFGSAAGAFLTS